jgi:hypothetical protein
MMRPPLSPLHPAPPVRPSVPVSGDISLVVSDGSTGLVAPPEALEDAAGSARGVTMQLDIRFWRDRWFWRLAAKAAVRFFRPQTSIEGSDVIDGHFK